MELICTNSKRDSINPIRQPTGLLTFILDKDLFILKTIKANFDAVAAVDVLIAINSGVKLVET